MCRLLLLIFSPRSQKFLYFRQMVNDVNVELGNACSLYQMLLSKPSGDWLQANRKLNSQLFWNNDLHLYKTGCQKFATSLFNFISSCSTSKLTSFDLRKISKSFLHCRKPTSTSQSKSFRWMLLGLMFIKLLFHTRLFNRFVSMLLYRM